MPVDPQLKALQDSIYREKVLRARNTPVGEKLATGPQMFDVGMGMMRGGIRSQHPDWSDEQVEQEAQRRLDIRRRRDERGFFKPFQPPAGEASDG